MDYKHIPFRCQKYHEHKHLYRDCPKKKITTDKTPGTDEEGFKKLIGKCKKGQKIPTISKSSKPTTNNIFGVLDTLIEEKAQDATDLSKSSKQPH